MGEKYLLHRTKSIADTDVSHSATNLEKKNPNIRHTRAIYRECRSIIAQLNIAWLLDWWRRKLCVYKETAMSFENWLSVNATSVDSQCTLN